jgi:aryl sulfotransferase
MTSVIPRRSRIYAGPLTDPHNWSNFEFRADDIIVATPSKCGTTWIQSIIAMLIFGRPGMDKKIGEISPWLDCAFKNRDEIARQVQAQTHRRCIKSHTPLDGLPYDPSCTYVSIYRHPMDAHFSMRTHVENMVVDLLGDRFPDDISEGFRMFVQDPSPDGDADSMTLECFVHHYKTFRDWAHLPNVHMFHYAELSRDLAGQIAKMALKLGYDHDQKTLASITEGARFETMKANAKRIGNSAGPSIFRDKAEFFSTGSSNKWETQLSADEVKMYQDRIAELLPPAQVHWLENGGAAPT